MLRGLSVVFQFHAAYKTYLNKNLETDFHKIITDFIKYSNENIRDNLFFFPELQNYEVLICLIFKEL